MENEFRLTKREMEVLELVVQGLNNKEIAKILIVSTHTSKAHVSNILYKLNVDSRIKAAVFAVKNGLA